MTASPGSDLMTRAIKGRLTVDEQRQCADAILAEYDQPNPAEMPDLNAVWLARAWLRANPADGGEVVTAEWVRAVLPATGMVTATGNTTGHHVGKYGVARWEQWSYRSMFAMWVNGRLITDADGFKGMTRGEFRSLCRGLRIELVEPVEVIEPKPPAEGNSPSPGQPEPAKPAGAAGGPHPLAWEVG